MKWLKQYAPQFFFLFLLPILSYLFLGYAFERSRFDHLLVATAVLAFSYGYVLLRQSTINWKYLFGLGLTFRLLFLFSFPALSDDIYRFIWDGILVKDFMDPYALLPSEMNQISDFQAFLLSKMNSPNYYSVYPPLLQYIFGFTAWLGGESLLANVVVFRSLIIIFEIFTFFLLRSLLKSFKLSRNRAFIYFLNPLVIIELSGNLHPEAFWICFILLAIFLLLKQKWMYSGPAFVAAVMIKLLPLLFAPLLLRKIKLKPFLIFTAAGMLFSLLLLLPLIDLNTIIHITDSIELYFRNFEFNASIYYLFNWLGSQFYGYNPIGILGPALGLLAALIILYIQLRKGPNDWDGFFKRMLLSFSIYYLLALVVHPWYLAPLIAIACFRSYLYPLLWSMLIFLSYHRYAEGVEQENHIYLWLEYLPLYLMLIFELIRGESDSFLGLKRKIFTLKT